MLIHLQVWTGTTCLVFLLCTSHSGGGLPLGAMIVSDESASTLKDGLSQMLTILPKNAFYNAADGPGIIMTDDSESQRQALTTTWPKATMLLCTFHVLQSLIILITMLRLASKF